MIERLKYDNTIDIYGHVTQLRSQRNYTVQTEDQYQFIYMTLLESLIAGPSSEVHIRNLYNHLQMLMQIVPGENCSALELEFRKIDTNKVVGKFTAATLPVNQKKNRLSNILPYDMSRVFLQPLHGVQGSDYINASFIDGYRYKNNYIATQGPLSNTFCDFWRMVYEHNSNIIVMLTKCEEMGIEKSYQYWPNEGRLDFMNFYVEPLAEYNMPQYILREFKITDKRDLGQYRTIRQFHFIDWPEQHGKNTCLNDFILKLIKIIIFSSSKQVYLRLQKVSSNS